MSAVSAKTLLGLPACLCLALVSSVAKGQADLVAVDVTSRYQRICTEYEQGLRQLQRQGASADEFIALARQRDVTFAQLIDNARLRDVVELSVPDLVSLAICCEYLRRREEALQYCSVVLSRAPNDESVYYPLIRTLLNLRRLEEAKAIVNGLAHDFEPTAKVHSLHGLLYVALSTSGDVEHAAHHLSQLFEFFTASLPETPETSRLAARRVQELLDAHSKSGHPQRAHRVLARLAEQLSTCFKPLEGDTIEELVQRSMLLNLDCELRRILEPNRFGEAQADWLAHLSKLMRKNHADPATINEVLTGLEYLEQHSHCWNEAVAVTLQEATETVHSLQQTSDVPHLLPILRQLEHFTALHSAQTELFKSIGQQGPILAEVTWSELKPPSEMLSAHAVVIHYFKSKSLLSRHLLNELERSAKRCPETTVIVIVATSELIEAQIHALQLRAANVFAGFVADDSEFARHYKSNPYSLTMLVASDGTVITVVAGVSHAKLRHVEGQLIADRTAR